MSVIKNCIVCGTPYDVCIDCDKRQTWRAKCDVPEHWQVYQVLIMYTRNEIDAVLAASQLKYVGVTEKDIGNFTENNRVILQDIFDKATPRVEQNVSVSEEIIAKPLRRKAIVSTED